MPVYEGFGGGGLCVPAVAGKCPAIVVAAVKVEQNRVFAWRGGWDILYSGRRDYGKDEEGKGKSKMEKASVAKHGNISQEQERDELRITRWL